MEYWRVRSFSCCGCVVWIIDRIGVEEEGWGLWCCRWRIGHSVGYRVGAYRWYTGELIVGSRKLVGCSYLLFH